MSPIPSVYQDEVSAADVAGAAAAAEAAAVATAAADATTKANAAQAAAVATAAADATTKANAAQAAAAAALAAHVGAADPHPGYQLESEKGAANGYASLNGSTKVVENPAAAQTAAAAAKIPISGLSGQLDSAWVAASLATGDVVYYDGTKLARLAVGTTGQALTVSAGLPAWGSLLDGWKLVYSQSFANVDVSGASFSLGGVTWTFRSKASGAWSSDVTGITISPNASAETGMYALLSAFELDWTNADLLILVERSPVAIPSAAPGAGYKTYTLKVCDSDASPFVAVECAVNSTAPSGQSMQAVKSPSGSTVKISPAVDLTTIKWTGMRIQGQLAAQAYTATSTDPNPSTDLTAISTRCAVENPNPGGGCNVKAFDIAANRGTEVWAAPPVVRSVRVFKRTGQLA